MEKPWFMHCHRGINTLLGVYGVPQGTYVRSWQHGKDASGCEVTFYPAPPAIRAPVSIGYFVESPQVEARIDEAVAAHRAAA